MSARRRPLKVPVYASLAKKPEDVAHLKTPLTGSTFQQAAVLLELHACLLTHELFSVLLAQYSGQLQGLGFHLGQNLLLQTGDGIRLTSFLIDKVGAQFDGFMVMNVQDKRQFCQESSSYLLYAHIDSVVRRLLGDWDGKGNSVATRDYYGAFDFGMAAAPALVKYFGVPADADASVKAYPYIAQMKLLAIQANPFTGWRYFDPVGEIDSPAYVAAEFFNSNTARIPCNEAGQRIFECLLVGGEELELPALIEQLLTDTQTAANAMLRVLQLTPMQLDDASRNELVAAAGGRLGEAPSMEIDDELVLRAYEWQVLQLQKLALAQLQIVEVCRESRASLLAYLLQALVVPYHMRPVIGHPESMKAYTLEEVAGFVLGKLTRPEAANYLPMIDALVAAVGSPAAMVPVRLCPVGTVSVFRQQLAIKPCLPRYALKGLARKANGDFSQYMATVKKELNKSGTSEAQKQATLAAAERSWVPLRSPRGAASPIEDARSVSPLDLGR